MLILAANIGACTSYREVEHMDGYLRIQGVTKTFDVGRGRYQALGRIDLDIQHGEFISIIGHSGCGKSTLLNLISGLDRPTEGTLALAGAAITGPGPDRGMVFQHHGLLPWLTVRENVFEAVDAVFPTMSKDQKGRDVEHVLRMVGLWDHRQKKPHQISGGMKQRTSIARAFAVHPKVLLLDEPFAALDALLKPALHDALVELWSSDGQSETVVMVTHDIDEAVFLSDRIVVMNNGPAATIREVVEVPLDRPRDKRAMVHSPVYAEIKDHLLALLTEGHQGAAAVAQPPVGASA